MVNSNVTHLFLFVLRSKMGRYNFSGDIEYVRSQQLDFISDVLEKRGIKGPDVIIEAVGTAGDNFVANVKRIVVNENGITYKMIAKLAPDNPMIREMGNMAMLFSNENIIYTQLLPKLRELQRSAGVPKDGWFRFAECYGYNSEIPHEVLLLEDLKEDNYVMLDRFKTLSDDCVKVVLKNLAIYHSLSYVLKHQEPETFAAFASQLEDMFSGPMSQRDDIAMQFQKMEEAFIAMMSQEKYKKAIVGSASNMVQHTAKVMKVDVGSKHSVIIQGDGWTNNILFKIENDFPINCVLIDYQMVKEASPVFDIMYMLFNSTSYEQRKKNFHEFIDYYHNELDKSLNNYGLKAAFIYPKDQLDADLRRYGKLMLSWCIMVSNVILRDVGEAAELKDAMKDNMDDMMQAMLVQNKDTVVLYRNKVEGMIDSFIELGLLKFK